MVNSLYQLCREADGEIVGSSIRGAPPGSVDACKIEHEQTGDNVMVYESDVEGGDFMFGDPDGFDTLITDVEGVDEVGTSVQFFLPDDGRGPSGTYSVSTSF